MLTLCTLLYLVTHFSQEFTYFRITQNGRLSKIPTCVCLSTKPYHTKSTLGQLMPDFCTSGQEMLLQRRSCDDNVSVKVCGLEDCT